MSSYSDVLKALGREDRKADFLECAGERLGKLFLVPSVAAKEAVEVERCDHIVFVELVAFMLGEAVGVRLPDLIVFREIAIERFDVGHARISAVAGSAECSRLPFIAARSMTAAA